MAELGQLIVQSARELFGYDGELVLGRPPDSEYLTDNPNRRCPDISKARAHLGFNPRIGIDEGIRRSMLWYSQQSISKGA
jgi:nucleoside-diphosphate-sugar epimerase